MYLQTIKQYIISVIVVGSVLLTTSAAFAANTTAGDLLQEGLGKTATNAGIDQTQGTATEISERVGTMINYLFGIIGLIFLTVILIGGYEWMTAGGSEEKVAKGKKFIINGINGIIVIFLAYALVYVVLASLGSAIGVNNTSPTPPAGTQ